MADLMRALFVERSIYRSSQKNSTISTVTYGKSGRIVKGLNIRTHIESGSVGNIPP